MNGESGVGRGRSASSSRFPRKLIQEELRASFKLKTLNRDSWLAQACLPLHQESIMHPPSQQHFLPLREDSWVWIIRAENTVLQTPFLTGLTVFQFSTLTAAYCETTAAQGKHTPGGSGITFSGDWWLAGCSVERPSWRKTRGCGQSGSSPCGVTTLEGIETHQILVAAEASRGSTVTLSSWPQTLHLITLTSWCSSIFKTSESL